MKTIYKYPVSVGADNVIVAPAGAQFLRFGHQAGDLFVWALIDAEAGSSKQYNFLVAGTGFPVPDAGVEYLGSTDTPGGFVWHCFQWQMAYPT